MESPAKERPDVLIETVGYSGHVFSDFHARRDSATGPGFYVFGRNAEKYGRANDGRGLYVKLCARPNVPLRAHPHYNGRVQRGWKTKREAEAIAAAMNAGKLTDAAA